MKIEHTATIKASESQKKDKNAITENKIYLDRNIDETYIDNHHKAKMNYYVGASNVGSPIGGWIQKAKQQFTSPSKTSTRESDLENRMDLWGINRTKPDKNKQIKRYHNSTPEKKIQIDPKFLYNEKMNQGHLGDCYFIASLDSMFHNPAGRREIFKMIKKQDDGSYNVVFKEYPKEAIKVYPEEIIKDTQVKSRKEFQIIELAYAKLKNQHKGNDEKDILSLIEWGRPEDALTTITGWKHNFKVETPRFVKNDGEFLSEYDNPYVDMIQCNSNMDYARELVNTAQKQYNNTLKEISKLSKEEAETKKLPREKEKNLKACKKRLQKEKECLDEATKKYNNTKSWKELIEFQILASKDFKAALDKLDAGKDKFIICATTPDRDYGSYTDINDPYDLTFMDRECRFSTQHAFSIRNVDSKNKVITVVNPHDTSAEMNISYDEFSRYFETICGIKVP